MPLTKELIFGTIGDTFVVILIGVSSILIRQLVTPYRRGFFKDDENLMYPYKESTIPNTTLYGVGFSVPSAAILITEGLLLKLRHKEEDSMLKKKGALFYTYFWTVYRLGLMFYFGVVVTHFSTNIPKYTIGRLRPHFFSACQPDYSIASSTEGYIEEDICTGNNTARIKEARVSFPSGHSSMSVYCSLFLVLYLERRFSWGGMLLLKSFLQVTVALVAFFTCLSRISDYKHHWSDVLAGAVLGVVVVIFVFWSLERNVLPQLPDMEHKFYSVKPLSKSTTDSGTGSGLPTLPPIPHRTETTVLTEIKTAGRTRSCEEEDKPESVVATERQSRCAIDRQSQAHLYHLRVQASNTV